MADACVQTHSSQAGDNLDMDELEVQTASAALNLTDDNMCQEEADSDYDSDCDVDDVDDALFFWLWLWWDQWSCLWHIFLPI